MTIKLIVGLGNVGAEYTLTRHNAGFWLIDTLARQANVSLRSEKKFFGDVVRTNYQSHEFFLLKPNTYMNLSGKAVTALAQFYQIQPQEILVVHDELDIDCGKVRCKLGGGNGGHNGLKHIQAQLGTPDFYRLRLGIGHPGDKNLVVNYVLNQPSAAERDLIYQSIQKSLDSLPEILDGKWEAAIRSLHSA